MSKFFNAISILKSIYTDRKKQLLEQKKQDDKLKSLKYTCPDSIIKFYYYQRIFNRVLGEKLNDSDILSYIETLEDNSKIIEDDLNQFEKIVLSQNNNLGGCNALNVYNRYLKKNIIRNIEIINNEYPYKGEEDKFISGYYTDRNLK